MDSLTFGIGLLAITACILPFILISRANRQHDQELKATLQQLATQQGLTISEFDIWHNNIIGLDSIRRTLIFHRVTETTSHDYFIRLDEVRSCQKVEKVYTRKEDGEIVKLPTHLGLQINYAQANRPGLYLSFFEDVEGNFLSGEGPLMNKWYQRINQLLPSYKIAA